MAGQREQLSDDEIDLLEREIPRLAVEATTAAYHRALSAGLSVLVVKGTDIVEVSLGAVDRVVGSVPPRRKVAVGKTIVVKRMTRARQL